MAKCVKTEEGYKNLDEANIMSSMNPVGIGSFSMNRKPGTDVGQYSHAEGLYTIASGQGSHAEGFGTLSSKVGSHAEGYYTKASGDCSHAEGTATIAASDSQHAQGKYNIEDNANAYAHIVGNGTSSTNRSNAHTLDWDGNAWYAGGVESSSLTLRSATENSTAKKTLTITDDDTLLVNGTELSALPTITEADEGGFLRVVNGKWVIQVLQNAEDVAF